MSEIFQQLKMMCRDNFGSVMFLMVVGIIALFFIGYLLIDYFRTLAITRRMKHRHHRESRQPEHH